MYLEYFGLKEASFSITPDPQYLFLSDQHREALAHLLYGAGESGGFVLLSGEVGTGKTTVCRAFLEQLPDRVDVALVLNPAYTAVELLHAICDEFRIEVPDGPHTAKALVDRLNAFLLDAHARSRRPVLIIDEAQNLDEQVLEQIRMLTNLETSKRKLLQIFLVGQPELRELLARDSLRQLNQRITARFHLTPLNLKETAAYIHHRLSVAGVERPLFSRAAVARVHALSGGVPRLINLLCDRALLGTAVSKRTQVSARIVERAAREVRGEDALPKSEKMDLSWALASLFALLVLGGAWWGGSLIRGEDPWPPRISSPAAKGPQAQIAAAQRAVAVTHAEQEPEPTATDTQTLPRLGVARLTEQQESAADAVVEPALPTESVASLLVPVAQLAESGRADIELAASLDEDRPESAQSALVVAPVSAEAIDATSAQEAARSSGEPVDELVGESVATEQADAADAAAQSADAPAAEPAEPADEPALAQDVPEIPLGPLPLATLDTASMDRATAFNLLLQSWGTEPLPLGTADPCKPQLARGLTCTRATARWSDLRQIRLPVLVRLEGGPYQGRFALVNGLGEEFAVVRAAAGQVRVPIVDLDQHWSGAYLLVWRPPLPDARVIGPGAAPEAVHWLRSAMLDLASSGFSGSRSGAYDSDLRAAVRRFQEAEDLDTDGIAGPMTLIQIGHRLDEMELAGGFSGD